MTIENPILFVVTSLLLTLYPGPDTFYIIGRSIAHGRRTGVISALGISTGAAGHALLGALGVTALLAASQYGLSILKYCGAAYLVFLGVKMILSKSQEEELPEENSIKTEVNSNRAVFFQGVFTDLLNPKVALFFLAFIPQFIAESSSSKPLAFILLSSFFLMTGLLWCVLVALIASLLRERFLRDSRLSRILNWIGGGLLVFLGLRLARAGIAN